jgi:hypothetical protein
MSKLVQEGGTAKTTTTAAALAVVPARSGTPTQLVDMDPQASLSRAFGLADESDGLCQALTDQAGLPVKTVCRNLTLTTSTILATNSCSGIVTERALILTQRLCERRHVARRFKRLSLTKSLLQRCRPSIRKHRDTLSKLLRNHGIPVGSHIQKTNAECTPGESG